MNLREIMPVKGITPIKENKLLTKDRISYIAGIVDGEGAVGIKRDQRGNYTYYYPYVKVCMGAKVVIDEINKYFPGSISFYKANPRFNRREVYALELVCRRAIHLLQSIYPYLLVKTAQAKLLFELGSLHQNTRQLRRKDNPSKITERTRRRQRQLYEKCRGLNKRGLR